MKIIKGLRLDWYISSSSGKVVWELLIPINRWIAKRKYVGAILKAAVRFGLM